MSYTYEITVKHPDRGDIGSAWSKLIDWFKAGGQLSAKRTTIGLTSPVTVFENRAGWQLIQDKEHGRAVLFADAPMVPIRTQLRRIYGAREVCQITILLIAGAICITGDDPIFTAVTSLELTGHAEAFMQQGEPPAFLETVQKIARMPCDNAGRIPGKSNETCLQADIAKPCPSCQSRLAVENASTQPREQGFRALKAGA